MIHCDLKPENILMDSVEGDDIIVKLTDFGFSKQLKSREDKM